VDFQSEENMLQSDEESLPPSQQKEEGMRRLVAALEDTVGRNVTGKQEFSAALLDTMGALIVVMDGQGRIVQFNRACEHSTGYSIEEVQGNYVWDILIAADEVEPVKDTFKALREGMFPNTFENNWVTKTGDLRWIAWSNTCLTNVKGEVDFVIGTGVDCTEARQTESALRTSEARYRKLLAHLDAGIVVHGPDTGILLSNPSASRLLGLKTDDMAGQPADGPTWRFINEDGSTMELEDYPVNRVLSSSRALHDYVVGINRPSDNSTIWVLVNAFPLFTADKALAEVVVTFVDITKRKEAEKALRQAHDDLELRVEKRTAELAKTNAELHAEIAERQRTELALRESEGRFRAIAESSFEGIAISHHGQMVDVNPTFLKLFGYTREELLNQQLNMLVFSEDREMVKERNQRGYDKPYVHRAVRKDGTILTLEVSGAEAVYLGEKARITAIRDITEKQEAEEERARILKELQDHLAEIKSLRGILPICVYCKKIRDDDGFWEQVDVYVRDHSEAEFSHGLCPECLKENYPEVT
jgi:PAS domain S-box-containing protein